MDFKKYLNKRFGKNVLKGIIYSLIIYFVISFVNVGVGQIFGFSWDQISYSLQPKPNIIVNIQEYTDSELVHTGNHSIQLFLITMCNQKEVLYNDIISSPLLGRNDVNVPFSYSNMKCEFDDGTPCNYYAFQIKNLGKAPAKSFTFDASTSSSEIKITNIASPKVRISENFGFFNEKGFRIVIDEIDVNETIGFLIGLDPDSKINSVCKVDGKQDLCIKNLVQVRVYPLKEGEKIEGLRNNEWITVDVSDIPNTWDSFLYDYDSETNSFVKAERIEDFECVPVGSN